MGEEYTINKVNFERNRWSKKNINISSHGASELKKIKSGVEYEKNIPELE